MKAFFIIIVLVVLSSCKYISVRDAAINQLVGSRKAYDELTCSKPIEACKFTPNFSYDKYNTFKNNKWILDYSKIKGKKLNCNELILESIASKVLDINSYKYGHDIQCESDDDFMLHYNNYKILFCFNCSLVVVCNKKEIIGGGILREDQSLIIKNIFLSLNESHN